MIRRGWSCCGTDPDDSMEKVEDPRAEPELLGTFATPPSPILLGSVATAKVLQPNGSAIGGRQHRGGIGYFQGPSTKLNTSPRGVANSPELAFSPASCWNVADKTSGETALGVTFRGIRNLNHSGYDPMAGLPTITGRSATVIPAPPNHLLHHRLRGHARVIRNTRCLALEPATHWLATLATWSL